LAEPDVPEWLSVEVVHAHRDVRIEPRRVTEVEGDLELGIEGAEQERQEPVVAGALDRDSERPESVTERAHTFDGRADAIEPRDRQLHGEPEPGRRLLGPADEL